jgi:uncharacterized YceG family protein
MSEVNLDYFDAAAGRQSPEDVARGKGRRQRKKRRLLPLLAIIVVLALVGGVGYFGYRGVRDFIIPPDYAGSGSGQVSVQVRDGDSVAIIGNRLHAAAVVKSPRAFVKAAQADVRATTLQPGFYQMRKRMSAQSALLLLLDPKSRADTRITIPEGLRSIQVFQALSRKTGIPQRDFQRAAASPGDLGLPAYAQGNVEGYLFPATYDLNPNAGPEEILKMMITRFNQVAADIDLEARAKRAEVSPHKLMVLASLAQAESGRDSDMGKVTRVVYNRMRRDMKLELDSTVMYALGKYGIVASNKDLQVNSPYNTYKYKRLPPGPIANPGRQALDAAFHPTAGDWIYFVTTDPKKRITKFTASYKTFLQYKKELQRNLGGGGGGG